MQMRSSPAARTFKAEMLKFTILVGRISMYLGIVLSREAGFLFW